MANEDLEGFADALSGDFRDAWTDLEDAIASMKRDFSQSERDEFRDCVNEGSRSDTVPCLSEKADKFGIAESFRREILQADGLVATLRSAGRSAAESNNVSEAVRNAADFSTVSELNSMCANPNMSDGDIEDELSDSALNLVGGGIDTYQDCVTATAAHADLKQSLKSAYGTA